MCPLKPALAAVAALSLGGCTTATLQPAPEAQLAGNEDVAVGRAENVELRLEPNAWNSFPRALDQRLTPLRVTLINNSGREIEVQYENFSMGGFDGVTYHPLPPLDIKGTVWGTSPTPVLVPRFGYSRFLVAPYFHPYYGRVFLGADPWYYGAYDPFYYQRYYPMWQIDLPTRDMIELAIPEGVVQAQGQVSGFFYFPQLEAADEGDRVTFTANLVDAKSGEEVGRIDVPLVVE